MLQPYTYTCRIHIDAMNKDEWRLLEKIYLSLYLKGCVWEGVGDRTKTATYWPPQPLRTSPCVVLVPLSCSTGSLRAQPIWDMFSFQQLLTNWSDLQTQSGVPRAPSAGWWLSLPHLVSNSSDLQPSDFLSSPSYIIVQSPTQSLEWHVWLSSSGNNCLAVHRSLSSGASVYECTMGFYLVPYCQQSPPTRFLLITAIGMGHFLPVHYFGMSCLAGSKVNILHMFGISWENVAYEFVSASWTVPSKSWVSWRNSVLFYQRDQISKQYMTCQ